MTWTPMPKIPRYYRDIVITEKLDGTNAAIEVTPDGLVLAFSKNRRLTPGKQTDNFGFAEYVESRIFDIATLPAGVYRGEWWGVGINRGYGLFERRFSVFNPHSPAAALFPTVPVLYEGAHEGEAIGEVLLRLRSLGSEAAPGFMNPEGIVIYHKASGHMYKVTLEHDDEYKGRRA